MQTSHWTANPPNALSPNALTSKHLHAHLVLIINTAPPGHQFVTHLGTSKKQLATAVA